MLRFCDICRSVCLSVVIRGWLLQQVAMSRCVVTWLLGRPLWRVAGRYVSRYSTEH